MLGASPRNSHYSVQMTPRQPEVLLHSGHELAAWEKGVEIGRPVTFFLGSLLFLLGSIYFYPEYAVMWDGNAGLFGSWCFVVGCIMFFTGANLDFIQAIRYHHGTQLRQVLRAYNALCNFMASSIFILGALYFLPTWYLKAPELGCWAFIIGSILFCIAAVVEIIFIGTTHEDPQVTGFKIKNLFCWATVAALGTFIGAALFTVGSWYYLPKYINLVDEGTDYMNMAITYYVIGSVFFIVNSFAVIPDVRRAITTSNARKHDLESKV